jgi:hypothetical protein
MGASCRTAAEPAPEALGEPTPPGAGDRRLWMWRVITPRHQTLATHVAAQKTTGHQRPNDQADAITDGER